MSAREIESRSFADFNTCAEFTESVESSFGEVLQKFVRDSMWLRDGKLIAPSSLPLADRGRRLPRD